MKRSFIINAVLAVIVAALALWMTLKPGDKEAPGVALSALKRDAVKKIRIVPSKLPEFVLEREGNRWVQTQPFRARTDESQSGRLLDLLAATAKDKLEAKDLGRFDLDKPFARVFFDDQEFAFGTLNTLTNEQYVLTGNGVYLVSPVFGYGLPSRPDGLASHMLLADDELPAKYELPGVTLESKDGKWQVSPAPAEAPSQDDLARWAESWRYASSLATQPAPADAKGERAKIVTRAGKTIEFIIAARTPNFVLVRPDEKLQYLFPPDTAAKMLQAPAPAPKAEAKTAPAPVAAPAK